MSMPAGGGGGVSLSRVGLQLLFIALAFYLWSVPLIQPIKLMVVLLHEMSHGLMALASGGTVYDIQITPDEGGACRSDGGNAILVAGAGYLGSMFFGGWILMAARGGTGVTVTYALLTLLVLGAAVTVLHDSYSRTFAYSLSGAFLFLGLLAPQFIGALFLRAIGTVSCLYALFDIYSDLLWSGPRVEAVENDAETFSALTGVPVHAVGLLWLLASLVFFAAILKASVGPAPAAPPPAASGVPLAKPEGLASAR